jgi:hypothetical protein
MRPVIGGGASLRITVDDPFILGNRQGLGNLATELMSLLHSPARKLETKHYRRHVI